MSVFQIKCPERGVESMTSPVASSPFPNRTILSRIAANNNCCMVWRLPALTINPIKIAGYRFFLWRIDGGFQEVAMGVNSGPANQAYTSFTLPRMPASYHSLTYRIISSMTLVCQWEIRYSVLRPSGEYGAAIRYEQGVSLHRYVYQVALLPWRQQSGHGRELATITASISLAS
jgi:hypothetical protein